MSSHCHVAILMTTYNGMPYVERQIQSILPFISDSVQLFISDDGSVDGTKEYLEGLNQEYVVIFDGPRLRSPSKNFEFLINTVDADSYILADQDDLWLPDRVSKVIEKLNSYYAVICDARLIDANDGLVRNSYYELRASGSGVVKNFIRNSYIGCCMAFSGRIRERLIPFPSFVTMHDEWIGFSSEFGKGVLFLPEKLISYRIHSSNNTPSSRILNFNLYRVLLKRVKIIRMLIEIYKRAR